MPYILDLTLYKYEFDNLNNTLRGIQSSKIQFIKLLYIMGLSESSLKTITKYVSLLLKSL